MNKNFEKAYENIKAPTDLKSETLTKMFQENKRKRPIYRYGALALAVCAAVLCFMFFRPAGAVYVTPVEEGTYYEEIELKDGRIIFVQNRVAISITPNAGQVFIGSDEEAFEGEETDRILVKEETESGGELICREITDISLPEIREDAWSNIGKQKIYVTALKTEQSRYQAAYEKDGIAYEVIGTGVTQKEFIDFLYAQVK